jgi:hypothetical protein
MWYVTEETGGVSALSLQRALGLGSYETVSALLKRWLLGTHQGAASKELLDFYLAEFAFRFNRRLSRHRGLLF